MQPALRATAETVPLATVAALLFGSATYLLALTPLVYIDAITYRTPAIVDVLGLAALTLAASAAITAFTWTIRRVGTHPSQN